MSTGIGTDNIDITRNEIDAMINIDLSKRIDKETKTSLEIIRIWTCGILQPEIPVHSYLLSTHAFGLDNIAHFYQIEFTEKEIGLKNALIKLSRNNLSNLRPHPAYEFFNYSHPTVLKRLKALEKIEK